MTAPALTLSAAKGNGTILVPATPIPTDPPDREPGDAPAPAALAAALTEALAFLIARAADGAGPEMAKERLRSVQARHPDLRWRLLWEEEGYDESVHYDLLLRPRPDGRTGSGGTVSLSYCPDKALPWPLRGVLRADDRVLVRVNGRALHVDQAIASLDFIWDEGRLMDRLVDVCLLQAILDEDPVELSAAELQTAMDAFRRAQGLYTAAETQRWMERRSLSHAQLEQLVRGEAAVARLRQRVTAGRVDAVLADAEHRAAFDLARIARIGFADEADARLIAERVRTGEIGFYEAAADAFARSSGRDARRPVGSRPESALFAAVRRGELSPETADAIFGAAAGEVVGPVPDEDGPALVLVLAVEPARPDDPATRRAVAECLFADWLARQREAAAIEWNWGNAGRTQAR